MIEEARIKKNLEKLSFPRLSGTIYELEAFKKVKQEVENLNLDYEVQSFTFSTFYSRIYPKIAFLSVSLILLTFYLNVFPVFSLILIFLLVGILIVCVLLTRKPENIQFVSKLKSQNLLVKLKPKNSDVNNTDRVILFISHIDSKGQRFKVRIRIRIIKTWIYSSVILAIIVILKNLIFSGFQLLFYLLGLIPLVVNMISSILLLLNSTDNSSNGAIDNASGLACNLELVNFYANPENRLTNYNLWFLFTGAEECGTMGVRFFYNNLENFNSNKSIIFNFESIANDVFLFPGGNEGGHTKDIDRLLLNNNRQLKIHHYITDRVLGTHSDGGFLGDQGLQGFGIGEVRSYEFMHTPNDTIDKINTEILMKLCLVLTDSLKEHDTSYNK